VGFCVDCVRIRWDCNAECVSGRCSAINVSKLESVEKLRRPKLKGSEYELQEKRKKKRKGRRHKKHKEGCIAPSLLPPPLIGE